MEAVYYPAQDEFLKLAGQGNLIPVTRRILADLETPLSAYRKIRGQGESFLFESVEGGEHIGRYSFVGCNPRAVIRQTGQSGGSHREWQGHRKIHRSPDRPTAAGRFADGLEVVEQVMRALSGPWPCPVCRASPAARSGSSATSLSMTSNRSCPVRRADDLKTPVMYFLIADELLIFDRVAQTITILVSAVLDGSANPEEAYEEAVGEIERLGVVAGTTVGTRCRWTSPTTCRTLPFSSNVPKEVFHGQRDRAPKNTSPRATSSRSSVRSDFPADVKAAPLDIYRAARSINPSPYMFLLELDGFSLVGASPEIHVRCEDRRVEIRPIAGTRRRGENAEEDEALEKELLADPKERAEHVMLVDLARNDLGRVCDFGSVQVKDLMTIERYSHVMHIVSQVEGSLSAAGRPTT